MLELLFRSQITCSTPAPHLTQTVSSSDVSVALAVSTDMVVASTTASSTSAAASTVTQALMGSFQARSPGIILKPPGVACHCLRDTRVRLLLVGARHRVNVRYLLYVLRRAAARACKAGD